MEEIEDAVDNWSYSSGHYHEDGSFCIDITIDMDEWGEDADEIWDALSDVCDDWDAGIDSDCNTYYVALDNDDDDDDDAW